MKLLNIGSTLIVLGNLFYQTAQNLWDEAIKATLERLSEKDFFVFQFQDNLSFEAESLQKGGHLKVTGTIFARGDQEKKNKITISFYSDGEIRLFEEINQGKDTQYATEENFQTKFTVSLGKLRDAN